ncbi:hypothetical protein OZ411_16595 [Bradyrhizobium sp. Arg237L]|uniref:hypothetical protein n=1 Tax=Bradyrhizobium sp. Arg237L TaxID=3003352 RepID=UPI00249E2AFB|nr:hypothetical protein [Bradyrhizobium sp. Arg237L]MDI4234426.1 hypothetical protein [Bradyrhizobium sp. Arg237L]
MLARSIYQPALCAIAMIGAISAAYGLSLEEIAAKLEREGYSQIREMKSGKITTFKATKNGKVVSLVVDSSGHVKELP